MKGRGADASSLGAGQVPPRWQCSTPREPGKLDRVKMQRGEAWRRTVGSQEVTVFHVEQSLPPSVGQGLGICAFERMSLFEGQKSIRDGGD